MKKNGISIKIKKSRRYAVSIGGTKMSDELLILESNIASIQDIGRYGLENYGFSINGALDQFAYKISNALLGNPLETPAIEVTAFNFALKSHVDISVCVTGAQAIVEADNEVMPQWETFILKKRKEITYFQDPFWYESVHQYCRGGKCPAYTWKCILR